MPANFFQKAFPGRHVAAADEDSRALEVLRAAREDGAMHQIADLLRPDAAITEYLVRPRIDGHYPVKHAGLGVGIQLDEDLSLVHYFSKIGCLTVSFLARISSIFGSPFMAR